jgi:hypothetical protein
LQNKNFHNLFALVSLLVRDWRTYPEMAQFRKPNKEGNRSFQPALIYDRTTGWTGCDTMKLKLRKKDEAL